MDALAQEACELVVSTRPEAPFIITCEHASQGLPAGWRWPEADQWLVDTHWAYDLGAAELARELCAATGSAAVLARFSRLLIDANRPADDPTVCRDRADGRPVVLNQAITPADRTRRQAYWAGYHEVVEQTVAASSASVVLALHSFTRQYEGQRRDDIELGVLFDDQQELGERLARALGPLSSKVHLNRPYSGKHGMIYSADHHARAAGKRAVEIEVRQDLAVDGAFRQRLVGALSQSAWWA
ncbi:MAG: N-formylglutamate amidohydrolase [Deltaproteobacteria bacterium]|nr:MAG: N-formylglutamate amidohydrolase [Deltaproteobacteria bacterium]